MDIEMSVAVSRNGFMDVLGVEVCKKDRERVRALIKDKVAICGRITHEQAMVFRKGVPLDCKEVIVLTSKDYSAPGCRTAKSFDEAIRMVQGEEKVIALGGCKVFEDALGRLETSVIHLTELGIDYPGERKFPEFDKNYWELVRQENHKSPTVTFKTFKRSCPLCRTHPRKFFGKPVKEQVFWDFYLHRGKYLAIYKKDHDAVLINEEANQELYDFIAWLKAEHREGWMTPEQILEPDHAHIFFEWRAIAPS